MLTELILKFPVPAALFSAKTGALTLANTCWVSAPELASLAVADALRDDTHITNIQSAAFTAAFTQTLGGHVASLPIAVSLRHHTRAARLHFQCWQDANGAPESVIVWLHDASEDGAADVDADMSEAILRYGAPLTGAWCYLTADGFFKYISPDGEALNGVNSGVAVDVHFSTRFRDQVGRVTTGDHVRRGLGGEALSYERLRFDHRLSAHRWHRVTLTPDYDAKGQQIGLFLVSVDVHERRSAEEKATRAELALQTDRRSGAFIVVEFNDKLEVTSFSPEACALFGVKESDVLGKTLKTFGRVDDAEGAEQRMRHLIANPTLKLPPVRLKAMNAAGVPLYVDWYRSIGKDATTGAIKLHYLGIDVSEEQRLKAQMLHSSRVDPLTGLANRDGSLAFVNLQLVAGAAFAILHIDLDRFKPLNDYRGYSAGDEVLQSVGQRLALATSAGDSVGRSGADTFLIVLAAGAGDTSEQLLERAQRVVNVIEPLQTLSNFSYRTTASAGFVYVPPATAVTAEALFNRAELAMYKAKSAGRDCMIIYDTTIANEQKQIHAKGESLREALRTNALDVYFQPLLRVSDNRIIGGEALARWRNREGQYVEPQQFVALAEELGLIHDLWLDVMSHACALAVRLNKNDGGGAKQPCPISVNVSPVQLRFAAFDQLVKSALNEANCDPSWITLEVTESAALSDESAFATLHNLAFIGIKCCVDDFGTGYSNFAHLKNLPLSAFKIDRSFVRDLANRDVAIVRGMISIGHALGLKVIAEGVEYIEELNALKALGCDGYQGFIASKAVPEADFVAMVEDDRTHQLANVNAA
jgi:diguanylate cyclase (GGDEF)-like protein